MVAGSHRALIQPAFVRRDLDLPQLDLPTATGDVTVHLSCTLHMAQPPVSQERRVLYTDFSLPTDEGARSPAKPCSSGSAKAPPRPSTNPRATSARSAPGARSGVATHQGGAGGAEGDGGVEHEDAETRPRRRGESTLVAVSP